MTATKDEGVSDAENESAPAKALKERGNAYFRSRDYQNACRCYSEALKLRPDDSILLSNRSAAAMALGNLHDALIDAQSALQHGLSDWAKGHYRLGSVWMKMEKWPEATQSFHKALQIDNNNAEIRKKYEEAKRADHCEDRRRQQQRHMIARDAAFRLRRARQADVKEQLIRQCKESMTCPEWDLDEYNWRPTFLPSMKMHPIEIVDEEKPYCDILVSYLKALSELNAPRECFSILRDRHRLAFYEREIQHAIEQKGGHIVMVGMWSCLLGMIAAKCGAKRITCIEQNQTMYKLSIAVLEANQSRFETSCELFVAPMDVFHCCSSMSPDAHDTERVVQLQAADIVVTDLFSHCTLGKGVLKTLNHIWHNLASSSCVMIPSAVEVYGYLAGNKLPEPGGFDFSALKKYCWHPHHKKLTNLERYKPLSDVFTLFEMNLSESNMNFDPEEEAQSNVMRNETVSVQATADGCITGIVTGFQLLGHSAAKDSHLSSWHRCNADFTQIDISSFGAAFQYLDPYPTSSQKQVELRLFQDMNLFYLDIETSQHRPRHACLPDWHFEMLLDDTRTHAYKAAIHSAIQNKQITEDAPVHVLDAGAGSGLLSMLAATQGADHVSAVEFPGHVSDLCEETLLLNGVFNQVHLIPKAIKTVTVTANGNTDMKSKAHILTMEVFDCGLIGEGALYILQHAHKHLLHPDAICIPCGASLFVQPVELDTVGEASGFDFQALNAFRHTTEYESLEISSKGQENLKALSDPALAFSFDFYEIEMCLQNTSTDLIFTAKTDGCFNAVLFWFDLYLDEEQTLTTNPYASNPATTWKPAVQRLPEHIIQKGQAIYLQATHDTHGFTFKVLEDLETRTELPPNAPPDWWQNKLNDTQQLHTHLMQRISHNPEEFRRIAHIAIKLASRSEDRGVNATEAGSFCTQLMR